MIRYWITRLWRWIMCHTVGHDVVRWWRFQSPVKTRLRIGTCYRCSKTIVRLLE